MLAVPFSVDVSGEEMMSCEHAVDYEKLLLSALLVNCTSLEVKHISVLGAYCRRLFGVFLLLKAGFSRVSTSNFY